MLPDMTRRTAIALTTSAALLPALKGFEAGKGGRLKQSACLWCYKSTGLEELARRGAEMGLSGIDLVDHTEWETVKKYGLTPAMTPGAGTIPVAWNRKENHDKLVDEMRGNIERAAAAKVPNVITFSGNRKGMSDDEGKDNCIIGLKRVKKMAEDSGITICVELLNSKVNHKDYMCDHTAWGVDLIKAIDSPRVKLLYDIYHMQIMEGDIIRTVTDNIQYIGHFHTGGVPGRHELDDTQELQWRTVAKAIADLKYEGFFAHEFIPVRDPMTSLKQAIDLCNV